MTPNPARAPDPVVRAATDHELRFPDRKNLRPSAVLGKFRDGVLEVTPGAVSLILESLDRIKELLAQNETLPRKQRLTGQRIYQQVWADGYRGSKVGVLAYLWRLRRAKRQVKVFIPLEFAQYQRLRR